LSEITQQGRMAAKKRLGELETELEQMCQWLDDGGYERAAIMLEDAQKAVAAAGWEMESDAARIAEMMTRRVSRNGHFQG
jgi:hypothetical protein